MTTINPTLGSLFRVPVDNDANAAARQARNGLYAHAATRAAQVQAPQLLRAAAQALQDLEGTQFARDQASTSPFARPMLAAPKNPMAQDPRQAQDAFTLLMASLIMLLGETNVASLKGRLEMLRTMAQSATTGHTERSAEYLQAVTVLEAATAAASGSEAQTLAARERVEIAQRQLQAAEQTLAGLDPESPGYAAALQARNEAREARQAAGHALLSAQTAHGQAMQAVQAQALEVDRLAQGLQGMLVGQLPKDVDAGMKRELDAGATMTLLMLRFAQLMGDSQETKLELDQEFFKEMQSVRQAYMERKSDEYMEAVKKAEQAKKVAGCIGILVAAVMTVVSVVLTVASAGVLAGVAVGLIGVSLLSLQALNMAGVTDFDPLAPVMDPIMKGVMFLAEQWSKVIKFALEQLDNLGVLDALKLPDNFVDMASTLIGTAQVMLGLVLAAVFAGPAAGSLVKQLMTKMTQVMGKIIDKIVEKLLAQILAKINEKLMSSAGVQQVKAVLRKIMQKMVEFNQASVQAFSGAKGQAAMAKLQMSAVLVEATGTATGAGMNAASGVYRHQAAQELAQVQLLQFISEQLKASLSDSVQAFIDQAESTTRFVNDFLGRQEEHFATAQFVATRKV